jgi:hypothetical protein
MAPGPISSIVHLNRVIKEHPAERSRDQAIVHQFSFPGGVPSHSASGTRGSIHERGTRHRSTRQGSERAGKFASASSAVLFSYRFRTVRPKSFASASRSMRGCAFGTASGGGRRSDAKFPDILAARTRMIFIGIGQKLGHDRRSQPHDLRRGRNLARAEQPHFSMLRILYRRLPRGPEGEQTHPAERRF